MIRRLALTVLACAGATGVSGVGEAAAQVLRDGEVHVVMETAMGRIDLAVDTVAAPITAANFLHYVDAGLYGGGTFYRAVTLDNQPGDDVRIEVIQGGMDRSRREEALPPIPLEGTSVTGLHHLDGTLSMARGGPDTARAEFFICVGDQPSLDEGGARNADGRGFAAFGRVLEGMDVVREIQSRPEDGQYLVERVSIVSAARGG